ncbi:hypothetical protein [Ascidiaceihabitans sp.]|uniref:hypothetical protein n=1 Tax=Ascidiaceihabitans sp. TaxID=1872644 RepID=UPI003297E91E
METLQADQTSLQCPNCAGQCLFSPTEQALTCLSCGTPHPVLDPENDTDASGEFPFDPNAPESDKPQVTKERAHQCQTCGGTVIFTAENLSERCPYCDGAVVLGRQDIGYRTKALIPFQADADFAQRQALAWVAGRKAAPSDLSGTVSKGRVAGLYVPFWTFDSEEAVNYWAKQTTGSGDNRRTRKIKGAMHIRFNDLLMPASPHVTPLIRDGILHDFTPSDLRPYDAGFLAGFAAERHHQSVQEGLDSNADDKRWLIRNHIRGHINKSGVHNIIYQTDTSGIHYRRILLPVWILHYSYRSKPYKVVVSGIDGRTFGERPFSKLKVAAYSAAISAGTIAFGLAWGAAGIL